MKTIQVIWRHPKSFPCQDPALPPLKLFTDLTLQVTSFPACQLTPRRWATWSPWTLIFSCGAASKALASSSSCLRGHGSSPWSPSWDSLSSLSFLKSMANTIRQGSIAFFLLRISEILKKTIILFVFLLRSSLWCQHTSRSKALWIIIF